MEDLISRQDLLNEIDCIDRLQMLVDGNLVNVVPRWNVNKIIENLPSAQSEQNGQTLTYSYCPNCGADTRG